LFFRVYERYVPLLLLSVAFRRLKAISDDVYGEGHLKMVHLFGLVLQWLILRGTAWFGDSGCLAGCARSLIIHIRFII